ncbi:hypothetical protein OSTOST_08876, partial [Ostertagia ostertagi]
VPNGSSGKNAPQGKNIYELTYSKDLELEAQKYADTCPSNSSSLASRNYSGENFGIVPSSSVMAYYGAIIRAVKSFWNEINMHRINEDMLFTIHLLNGTMAPLRFTQVGIRWHGLLLHNLAVALDFAEATTSSCVATVHVATSSTKISTTLAQCATNVLAAAVRLIYTKDFVLPHLSYKVIEPSIHK